MTLTRTPGASSAIQRSTTARARGEAAWGRPEDWIRAVFACNQYVDAQAPWTLRKTDPERMRAVLMTLFQAVRTLAIAIRPVVPAAADKLLDQMGLAEDARDSAALADEKWFATLAASGFTVGQPVPIFPRLELPEGTDDEGREGDA